MNLHGPLKIMKRLAEGPELREKVKRLRMEIEERIVTEAELQNAIDYCEEKIHKQAAEIEQRGEAMQYMDEESELQNELDSCKHKFIQHWRAFDVKRREVQSLKHERAASDEKLRDLERRAHADVKSLQHEKAALEDKLEKLEKGVDAEVKSLQREKAALKEQLVLVREKLADAEADSLQRENAALKEKLEKPTNVLATVLFWLDRLYRDIATNDDDEQDEFLDGIKADLGPQECDELLQLGKALCDA
ncbi:hypothetical protein IWX90DRAFT_318651 [Phyllosticta citrichinensis]|uniref:Uncharacterized protein n=1 Tax=Phyllosticta citrichinensis TaxID=1130410 RepID=A0ABR1XJQ2_9PEZI